MFKFIKYSIWTAIKVRAITFWWTLKYGGKKNIPPELIFGRMKKSMENMNKNLMDALRVMPGDISKKEKEELMDLIRTGAELDRDIKSAIKENEIKNRNKENSSDP